MKRKKNDAITRRDLIAGAAATAGAALISTLAAQGKPTQAKAAAPAAPMPSATPAGAAPVPPPVPLDPTLAPGAPTSAQSARSPFVSPARTPVGVQAGASFTPLHQLTGTMTPNDLMFERHHSGVPYIDPARHRLVIHGNVRSSLSLTLADLKRFPSVSRVHFLECSGNGRAAYKDPKPDMTAQVVDGLTCNGEWTGVPLKTLLNEAGGITNGATWILAEGSDAAKLSRSVPVEKAMDDAMVAYAFNGEPLRPSNGYPMRLFLPGYEGNMNIKWLRRLKVVDQPNMSKDETSKYTDPLLGQKARMFSFVLDAKSVITWPATGQERIGTGWHEISGIAWSGRGKVTKVDVSTDGGVTWSEAKLHGPVQSKAHTRFTHMFRWIKGNPAVLMSRATDETGYVQPTRKEFEATRGPGTDYHYNYIRAWQLGFDGQVVFGGAL